MPFWQMSLTVCVALAIVVAMARLFGWLARRFFGQPQVVGEMIAGVALGPSVLGLVAPGAQAALFPASIGGALYVTAQVGVALYMFLVGLGFERSHFQAQARSAGAVSVAGIAVPFAMAVPLAPWLVERHLFAAGVGTLQATLFLGACISITAFPVLARILRERGLSHSPLGSLALSAGAINDAFALAVLALVLAAYPMDHVATFGIFAAFLLGVVLPRGRLTRVLRARLEPVTCLVLVPVFFTYSGLNTRLALVADPAVLGAAALVLAVSILAKFGACWAAARLTGQSNATALGLGALMNARGLMELIIANIGLQAGLIGPEMFTVLVVMTLVTTLMTTPLFERVYARAARARGELGALAEGEVIEAPAPAIKA